jgi:hypothetical protein
MHKCHNMHFMQPDAIEVALNNEQMSLYRSLF